jgi:hypothetical protein
LFQNKVLRKASYFFFQKEEKKKIRREKSEQIEKETIFIG